MTKEFYLSIYRIICVFDHWIIIILWLCPAVVRDKYGAGELEDSESESSSSEEEDDNAEVGHPPRR